MPTAAKRGKAAIKDAHIKALERALREERLALAAVVKVMLIEVPDPARVLARLDAMSRAAEQNPRTSAAVRKQLLDATLFVKTAIQRERGRPQELFEPDVGHTRPKDVDALVEASDGPQQLGLVNNEQIGDAGEAHDERVRTIGQVHTALIGLYREHGALSDRELHGHYAVVAPTRGLPRQTQGAVTERRRELLAAGRLSRAEQRGGEPAWDLVERPLLEASA